MIPVSGLARLAGLIFLSVHMGISARHRAEISAVSETNKARPFKFHPGNRSGVLMMKSFGSVTGLAHLLV